MGIELREPFRDLSFMTPLSQARAGTLVDFLAADLTGTVLDVGCGWAELLLRVVAAAPGVQGVGIDLDANAVEQGRVRAAERGLADRTRLVVGDARSEAPGSVDAVLCIGASQVWGPPVENDQPMDYAAALHAIRALVGRGARVVYGEGIWSRPPTAEAIAPLAGRTDELVGLAELVDLAVACGFAPVRVQEASPDEWDEFESGYTARFATWLAEHAADHPDAAEVADRAASQRAAYLSGYRGVLGLAYLQLVAV